MMKNNDNILEMSFDPNVITHLGINMYSTLPPVIAELIANAYDAEATEVKIFFIDENEKKEIIVMDNGHGMSFEEINEEFLKIGRNRRQNGSGEYSKNKKRKVIGKKGLGKLAFFGVAEKIIIETVNKGKLNVFELDWLDLQEQGKKQKKYNPKIIKYNEVVSSSNGTIIHLKHLKRKTHFDSNSIESIAIALSKYFTVFNEEDFNVILSLNQNKKIQIRNEMKYSAFNTVYEWNIPEDIDDENLKGYFRRKNIYGKFFYSIKTIREQDRGIVLYSRGKLVNESSFFDVKATSHGYAYITGYLNVDFIDDIKEELISTNRQSLNWEHDITNELKIHISEVLKKFYNKAKKEKEERKKDKFKNKYFLDIENWINSLPRHEKKLAKKIIETILGSEGIEEEKSVELIKFTIDSFRYESFKELAFEIEESNIAEPIQLINLFKEWKVIESREFYKIAKVRIETIKQFEKHINENSREVPEMHSFFKEFPWILDPRIMNFKDEITYSKLLKERFKELDEDESNRRIDFLCIDFAESLFIIELKRPKSIVNDKVLDQALDYVAFIEERIGNDLGNRKVYCIVVGGKLADTAKTRKKMEAYKKNNDVFFKSYLELLKNAKKYHEEFIEKYQEMNI